MPRKEHRDGAKHCSACRTWKPLSEFGANRTRWDGLRGACRSCEAASFQRRYAKHRERMLAYGAAYRAASPERRKDTYLRSRFGISLTRFEGLLADQGGGCAICGETSYRALDVDHRHSDGVVRGLLCPPCNRGLGLFGDSVAKLRGAADYVLRHEQTGEGVGDA